MKRQWLAGVWAFLGVPAVIALLGYSEAAFYRSAHSPNALDPFFVIGGTFIPGACVGLGLLAVLSLMKSGWLRRAIVAAIYGTVMVVLAETVGSPVIATHAVVISLPGATSHLAPSQQDELRIIDVYQGIRRRLR
jgi:hypothetical protein